MAETEKRIVVIAKELNVGVSHLIEHLHKRGYKVEHKPTSKIPMHMYGLLRQEFSQDRSYKQQVDKIRQQEKRSNREKAEDLKKKVKEKLEQTTYLPEKYNKNLGVEYTKKPKKKAKKKAKMKTATTNGEQSVVKKIKRLSAAVDKNANTSNKIVLPSKPLKTSVFEYSIPWNDVSFSDGHIHFKKGSRLFEPFQFQASRRSLNSVKQLYVFRNAPELRVRVSVNTVIEVMNINVLNYYIMFLSFKDTIDTSHIPNVAFTISKYRNYDKHFYKKNLPDIFVTECMKYLCEQSLEKLPIIPVPEAVIDSKGSKQIHDSFLFPIAMNKLGITWIWESVLESKASYMFWTLINYEPIIQKTYDYLVGDRVNKRQTLIELGFAMQHDVGYRRRIFHTDLNIWKWEIDNLKH